MTDASWALQRAVFRRLTEALAPNVPVLDSVPPTQPFPYVTIGANTSTADNTKTTTGQAHTVNVIAHSRNAGRKQVLEILGTVREALLGAPLDIEGHHHIDTAFEFSSTDLDPDGQTLHGVHRFGVWTQALEG